MARRRPSERYKFACRGAPLPMSLCNAAIGRPPIYQPTPADSVTMADVVNPFSPPMTTEVQTTLQALTVRVSQLAAQVEGLLGSFEIQIHHLSNRLHSVEKRQAQIQPNDEFRSPKRAKVDDFRIPIPEKEISFMHSQLTGPVKEAVHELGRVALYDQEIALRFLRIGSDKAVATSALHSKELQATRDSINWSFLPVDVIEHLEHRFVKTIAKKVEHTKRKIRQNAAETVLATAKYGKTELPFLEHLLERLAKGRDVGKCETTCSSLSTLNMSPNTAASSSDDIAFEAKPVFAEMPQRTGIYNHSLGITILEDCPDVIPNPSPKSSLFTDS